MSPFSFLQSKSLSYYNITVTFTCTVFTKKDLATESLSINIVNVMEEMPLPNSMRQQANNVTITSHTHCKENTTARLFDVLMVTNDKNSCQLQTKYPRN